MAKKVNNSNERKDRPENKGFTQEAIYDYMATQFSNILYKFQLDISKVVSRGFEQGITNSFKKAAKDIRKQVNDLGDVPIKIIYELPKSIKLPEFGKINLPVVYDLPKSIEISNIDKINLPITYDLPHTLELPEFDKINLPVVYDLPQTLELPEFGKINLPITYDLPHTLELPDFGKVNLQVVYDLPQTIELPDFEKVNLPVVYDLPKSIELPDDKTVSLPIIYDVPQIIELPDFGKIVIDVEFNIPKLEIPKQRDVDVTINQSISKPPTMKIPKSVKQQIDNSDVEGELIESMNRVKSSGDDMVSELSYRGEEFLQKIFSMMNDPKLSFKSKLAGLFKQLKVIDPASEKFISRIEKYANKFLDAALSYQKNIVNMYPDEAKTSDAFQSIKDQYDTLAQYIAVQSERGGFVSDKEFTKLDKLEKQMGKIARMEHAKLISRENYSMIMEGVKDAIGLNESLSVTKQDYNDWFKLIGKVNSGVGLTSKEYSRLNNIVKKVKEEQGKMEFRELRMEFSVSGKKAKKQVAALLDSIDADIKAGKLKPESPEFEIKKERSKQLMSALQELDAVANADNNYLTRMSKEGHALLSLREELNELFQKEIAGTATDKDIARMGVIAGKVNQIGGAYKGIQSIIERSDFDMPFAGVYESIKSIVKGAAEIADKPVVALGLFAGAWHSKLIQPIVSDMVEIGGSARDLTNVLSTSTAAAVDFRTISAGVTFGNAQESGKELIKLLGTSTYLTEEMVRETAILHSRYGISTTEAAKLLVTLNSLNSVSSELAASQIQSLEAMAQAAEVPMGVVMEDAANNSEYVAMWAGKSVKNFAEAAIKVKKLGGSLKDVASIADNLLDFETSIQKQMQLSVLAGRQLSFDRARQLAFEGKHSEMLDEVLNQFGSIEQFNNMNYFAQKNAADLLGMELGTLKQMIAQREKEQKMVGNLTDKYGVLGKKAAEFAIWFNQASGAIGNILPQIGATANFFASMSMMTGKTFGQLVKWLNPIKIIRAASINIGKGFTFVGKEIKKAYAKLLQFLGLKKTVDATEKGAELTDTGEDLIKNTKKLKGIEDKIDKGGKPRQMKNPLVKWLNTWGRLNKKAMLNFMWAAGVMIVSLAGLALALRLFNNVEWASVGKGMIALTGLALSMKLLGKIQKDILQGALAMGVMSAGLAAIAFGFSFLKDVDWKTITTTVLAIPVLAGVLVGLGTLIGSVFGGAALGLGIAGLVAIGLAMTALGLGLKLAAPYIDVFTGKLTSFITGIKELDTEGITKVSKDIAGFGKDIAKASMSMIAGIGKLVALIPLTALAVVPLKLLGNTFNYLSESLKSFTENAAKLSNIQTSISNLVGLSNGASQLREMATAIDDLSGSLIKFTAIELITKPLAAIASIFNKPLETTAGVLTAKPKTNEEDEAETPAPEIDISELSAKLDTLISIFKNGLTLKVNNGSKLGSLIFKDVPNVSTISGK